MMQIDKNKVYLLNKRIKEEQFKILQSKGIIKHYYRYGQFADGYTYLLDDCGLVAYNSSSDFNDLVDDLQVYCIDEAKTLYIVNPDKFFSIKEIEFDEYKVGEEYV